MLELDFKFWIAVVGAALIRVVTSERKSFVRSMLTVGMAVFSAWTFTDATLDWFNLPPATYRYPIAVRGGRLLVYLVDKYVPEARIKFILRTAIIVISVLIIALMLLRFAGF